jgi:hypothetical protein
LLHGENLVVKISFACHLSSAVAKKKSSIKRPRFPCHSQWKLKPDFFLVCLVRAIIIFLK